MKTTSIELKTATIVKVIWANPHSVVSNARVEEALRTFGGGRLSVDLQGSGGAEIEA